MKIPFLPKKSLIIPEEEYEKIKNQMLDGTANKELLAKFHSKLASVSNNPLNDSLLELKKEALTKKNPIRKVAYYIAGIFFLGLGILFHFNLKRPKKSTNNETSLNLEHKEVAPLIPKQVLATVKEKTHVVIPSLIPEQLNFCGEAVPVQDHKILKRMKVAIKQTKYTQIASYFLKKRVKTWFPVIAPILKRYKIPEDFKYIPLVETGLANSVSGRGAVGFWQLMEGTAKQYGLKVNDSIDERLDVRKSTIAACKYIRDLHRQMGTWTLTAAAYNMGAGGLQRKQDIQKMHDFYYLKLNPETSKYLYKTLAFKKMLSKPPKKKTLTLAGIS